MREAFVSAHVKKNGVVVGRLERSVRGVADEIEKEKLQFELDPVHGKGAVDSRHFHGDGVGRVVQMHLHGRVERFPKVEVCFGGTLSSRVAADAVDDPGDSFGRVRDVFDRVAARFVIVQGFVETDLERVAVVDDRAQGLLQLMRDHAREVRDHPAALHGGEPLARVARDAFGVGLFFEGALERRRLAADRHRHAQFVQKNEEEHDERDEDVGRVPLDEAAKRPVAKHFVGPEFELLKEREDFRVVARDRPFEAVLRRHCKKRRGRGLRDRFVRFRGGRDDDVGVERRRNETGKALHLHRSDHLERALWEKSRALERFEAAGGEKRRVGRARQNRTQGVGNGVLKKARFAEKVALVEALVVKPTLKGEPAAETARKGGGDGTSLERSDVGEIRTVGAHDEGRTHAVEKAALRLLDARYEPSKAREFDALHEKFRGRDEKVVVAHEVGAVGTDAGKVRHRDGAGSEGGAEVFDRRVDEVAAFGRTEMIDDADAHGLLGACADDESEEKEEEEKRAAHVGR